MAQMKNISFEPNMGSFEIVDNKARENIEKLTEATDTLTSEVKTHPIRYRISNLEITTQDWKDNIVYIKNENITSESVIDIYFNQNCLTHVSDLDILYEQGDGWLKLTSTYTPTKNLIIDALIIENDRKSTTGTVCSDLTE